MLLSSQELWGKLQEQEWSQWIRNQNASFKSRSHVKTSWRQQGASCGNSSHLGDQEIHSNRIWGSSHAPVSPQHILCHWPPRCQCGDSSISAHHTPILSFNSRTHKMSQKSLPLSSFRSHPTSAVSRKAGSPSPFSSRLKSDLWLRCSFAVSSFPLRADLLASKEE